MADDEGRGYGDEDAVASPPSFNLDWRRLSAWVKVRDTAASHGIFSSCKTPATREKRILSNVTGSLDAGTLVGILGPSGSGKTSLLSILGGRSGARVEGRVSISGTGGISKAARRRIGFVTQDDVVWSSLTVSESLMYAAELRLPSGWPSIRRMARVDAVIATLGLRHVADTPVGGAARRGLSGGERKRLCIGLELLSFPRLMLLDEPSSGLDATTALRLVTTLRELTRQQAPSASAALLTVHQPSSRCDPAPLPFALPDRTTHAKFGAALRLHLRPKYGGSAHLRRGAGWCCILPCPVLRSHARRNESCRFFA